MATPFPSGSWNLNVYGSGLTKTGNVIGNTVQRLGSIVPATGMPVFFTNFPVTPQRYVDIIDPNFGLITVAISGATGQGLYEREYPWNVNIWDRDAAGYGWPTGKNCISGRGHSSQVLPTGIGTLRGVDNVGGAGFIYG